ncbi:MAG TPA: nuclear transport factor 2 family protein [Burkholderiaceae bacterium]|nr:nuclear transport factor 2 family protein [Burkholderiaceae bacterium]
MTQALAIQTWHQLVRSRDMSGLKALLAEDAVFYSPVVHTPQQGRKMVQLYLMAANSVFINDSFHYVREVVSDKHAVLEFEVEIDGILVNGVDMITWNEQNKIIEFKVMLRPLKAINLIHQKMGQMLEAYK